MAAADQSAAILAFRSLGAARLEHGDRARHNPIFGRESSAELPHVL
jgi:hypothetical protein